MIPVTILFTFNWLQTKLTRIDINALMSNYELLSEAKGIDKPLGYALSQVME